MGPIANKIRKRLLKSSKHPIFHNREFKALQLKIKSNWITMESPESMPGDNSVFTLCTLTQNMASLALELLSDLPEMELLASLIINAEKEYVPQGPPISPITLSMFCYWALFDLRVGQAGETFGTILNDLVGVIRLSEESIEMLKILQTTKMTVYEYKGFEQGFVFLQELITGERLKCWVASGYKGKLNELWYVRVFPSSLSHSDVSIVLTTPYVLMLPEKSFWSAFVKRTLERTELPFRNLSYESLMKHGVTSYYWLEYVFLAYVNHRSDMIIITGEPDYPQTLPHSPKYRKLNN